MTVHSTTTATLTVDWYQNALAHFCYQATIRCVTSTHSAGRSRRRRRRPSAVETAQHSRARGQASRMGSRRGSRQHTQRSPPHRQALGWLRAWGPNGHRRTSSSRSDPAQNHPRSASTHRRRSSASHASTRWAHSRTTARRSARRDQQYTEASPCLRAARCQASCPGGHCSAPRAPPSALA